MPLRFALSSAGLMAVEAAEKMDGRCKKRQKSGQKNNERYPEPGRVVLNDEASFSVPFFGFQEKFHCPAVIIRTATVDNHGEY